MKMLRTSLVLYGSFLEETQKWFTYSFKITFRVSVIELPISIIFRSTDNYNKTIKCAFNILPLFEFKITLISKKEKNYPKRCFEEMIVEKILRFEFSIRDSPLLPSLGRFFWFPEEASNSFRCSSPNKR